MSALSVPYSKRSRSSSYKGKSRYPKYKKKTSAQVSIPYSISKGLGPFPMRLKNTLRYSGQPTLSTAAGAAGNGTYSFRANGMYDPDFTGVGKQPVYFDQLCAVYNHYTVLYSKISVQIASSENKRMQWCLFKDDDSTTGATTNMPLACMRSGAISGYVNPAVSAPPVVSMWWSARQTFGGDPLANDELQGNSSSNPVEETFYHFQIQELDGNTINVQLIVDIEYTVVWDELVSVIESA